MEVVNAVDDRRRRAEGEGTIVGPLGVKRGREGGTYLYLLPRLSPMCSASIQIANFFKGYPEKFDRKGF